MSVAATRRGRASAVALLVLVAGLAGPGRAAARPAAVVGEAAPAFAITDLDGRLHRLSEYRGRAVVLEWTSPDCPFVGRAYAGGIVSGTIISMRALAPLNAVYLAVNSAGDESRDEIVSRSREFLREHGLETLPVLIDHDGAVGRRYGARRTPHVFVIDADGILRYHGAYTDDPSGRPNNARNHVMRALSQIAANESVTPSYVIPWGCAVRYGKESDEATERRSDEGGSRDGSHP